jgi:PleD family two-component response regulator
VNAQQVDSFIDISQLEYNSKNISGCTPDSSSVEPANACDCVARILCVDDSEFNIIPVKNMIEENFHIQVNTANNGQEALQMFEKGYLKKCGCQNRTHNLILMDL